MAARDCCRNAGVGVLLISAALSEAVCFGDEQAGVAAAASRAARGVVVVIRGLIGYWPGCGTFCQRVRAYDEDVLLYTPLDARWHAATLASRMQSGRWSHLRIVGYSQGADVAIELARDFQKYGVPVERLILIEATAPKSIPRNVGYCYNVYGKRPSTDWLPAFRGVSVRRESTGTYLTNHNVRPNDLRLSRLNHFNFASDARLQVLAAYQAGAPSQGSTATVADAKSAQNDTSTR
jgi:pimeloyl-ACP methyl ester carboxylesterase